jgi:hypothetical protein
MKRKFELQNEEIKTKERKKSYENEFKHIIPDVIKNILEYLNIDAIYQWLQVSKDWNDYITNTEGGNMIWNGIFRTKIKQNIPF